MEKVYSPPEIERRLYSWWESSGLFAPRLAGDQPGYCIVVPPPNVTGTLHMGHAFQDTIMDTLTRFHRMHGQPTLWQPGTDHAGIATQMVVERQLNAEGKKRTDLSREEFLARVWQWKAQSGGAINQQFRRLGASLDWSRDCFTMDERLTESVVEAFVRLHDEGLIYRGKRLVNWDPVLLTAVSDLEVLSAEEEGSLWHLRYPLADGSGHLVVATTRPETMLGDSAVAVNPDDERYRHLIGRQIRLPIADRLIPIIADSYVDPEFGTGCVKITPAHDFNDYEVGQRHALPQINIFTPQARINENAPAALQGLDRFEARKQVVAEFERLGLLEKIDPHKLMVPRGDRSGAVIEPYLTDQWYVKIAPLAEPAIRAVESGEIRFVPENWSRTYFEWMRNIKDWCISRQLWWGHRIPAWYDDAGKIYVGRNEAEVRAKHGLAASVTLRQDEDVLDTWFSSGLWPFSTLGWPGKTPELEHFYPTSVLVTGFDIIFFWVARMIMMGIKFTGQVPFREVYVHGLVRDSEGQKMSKSKGNVIDPLDVVDGILLEALVKRRTTGLMQPHLAPSIEKATRKAYPDGIPAFGTDALRFSFASLATQSADIRFDLQRVAGYRNFCNKLWNASRFVLMMVEGSEEQPADPLLMTGPVELSVADRWITSRLGQTLTEVDAAFRDYRFDFAATALYEFTWYSFCDWYLELTKPVLQASESSDAARRGARRTLVTSLEALLRALHPIMPFITEEIWLKVAPLIGIHGSTVMTQPFPRVDDYAEDKAAATEIAWLKTVVLGVRRIRAESNIEPGKRIPLQVFGGSATEQEWLTRGTSFIQQIARIEKIERVTEAVSADATTALAGETTLLVPLMDLIDPAVEAERLTKELARLEQDLARVEGKLANESFVSRAPAEVVDKERKRAADNADQIARLRSQLDRLRGGNA